MRRRWVRACGALLVAGSVAGCAPTVHGSAHPDWTAVDAAMAERFDHELDRLFDSLDAIDPFTSDAEPAVTGVSYTHMQFDVREVRVQSEVIMVGNPVSVVARRSSAYTGLMIDRVHVAGDLVDYLLLGDAYVDLAPTPWVQAPSTINHDEDSPFLAFLNLCFVEGFDGVCNINNAIYYTEQSDAADRMRKSVTVDNDGGVHARTEVTFAAAIQAGAVLADDDVVAMWSEEMLESFIPVSFWLDPEGRFVKIELNGTVQGTGDISDVTLQVGFEVTGVATEADIPARPAPEDVTVLTRDDLADFYARMEEILMERIRAEQGELEAGEAA